MLATLMLAAIAATTPFPVAADTPDLRRLRDAWQSAETDAEHRGELGARIRQASDSPAPDWRRIADDYFAWRNAEARRADALRARMQSIMVEAAALEAARPVVCTTHARSEPGLYGSVETRSTTSCSK